MGDGWHENTGSAHLPVPEGTLIDVVYRNGTRTMGLRAGFNGAIRWCFDGGPWDIMKWCLHEKKEAKITPKPSNQEEQAMLAAECQTKNVTTRGGVHESMRELDDSLFDLSNVLTQVEDALVPVLGPVLPAPPTPAAPGPGAPASPGDSALAQRIWEQAVRAHSLAVRLRELLGRVDL